MKLKRPPKRVIRNIALSDNENKRFLKIIEDMGYLKIIERFLRSTDMYLRGRTDGASGSYTEGCGYIFLNKQSFENGHRPIAFFDPFPTSEPLKLSFRRWNKTLPFAEHFWKKRLDADDRLQPNMRIKFIKNETDLKEVIDLAMMSRITFSNVFDLSVSRVNK